jgi:hydroxyacylglutathione hydrolase
MEIQSGVYLLEGVRGANCYFVSDNEGTYLIDTGMPGNSNKIIREIGELGYKPEEIRFILLTHSDIDHAGSVAKLKSLTNAKIAIHQNEAPILTGERKSKKGRGLFGLILRLLLKNIKFETIQPDILLCDRYKIGPFTVIYVPGHTEGSICFYDAGKGIIFAGDALRTDKKGNPYISPDVMNFNTFQAKESIKKLTEVEFHVILPGHGKPILKEASQKIAVLNQKNCLGNK